MYVVLKYARKRTCQSYVFVFTNTTLNVTNRQTANTGKFFKNEIIRKTNPRKCFSALFKSRTQTWLSSIGYLTQRWMNKFTSSPWGKKPVVQSIFCPLSLQIFPSVAQSNSDKKVRKSPTLQFLNNFDKLLTKE
jgi:hypothetical protein